MEYITSIAIKAFVVVTDYSKAGFWLFWLAAIFAALRGDGVRPANPEPLEKEVFGTATRTTKVGGRIGKQVD